MHRAVYVAHTDHVDTKSHPAPEFTCSVVTGQFLFPDSQSDLVFTTHKTKFRSESTANMWLLKSF